MTGYSKKGGKNGHHKIRGKSSDRKKANFVSLNKNTMHPKVQNSADKALGQLRGNHG